MVSTIIIFLIVNHTNNLLFLLLLRQFNFWRILCQLFQFNFCLLQFLLLLLCLCLQLSLFLPLHVHDIHRLIIRILLFLLLFLNHQFSLLGTFVVPQLLGQNVLELSGNTVSWEFYLSPVVNSHSLRSHLHLLHLSLFRLLLVLLVFIQLFVCV